MRIRRLVLLTSSLPALQRFYLQALGFRGKLSAGDLCIRAGWTELHFHSCPEEVRPVYHFAFNIPPVTLIKATAWLKLRTNLLPVNADGSAIADFKNWNAKSVYFFDPAGNILEFIARYDLSDAAERQVFDAKQISCISEIGLVADNVDQLRRELHTRYGLSDYEKQPPGENFAALGNAEGLFILSSKERHWYPTQIPAAAFPLEIEFEQNGKTHHLQSGIARENG